MMLAMLASLSLAPGATSIRVAHGPRRWASDVAWALLCERQGVQAATLGKDVEVRSAGSKGLGLFAKRRLTRGQCLVRYTGALRPLAKFVAMQKRGETSGRYAIKLGSDWVIDAESGDDASCARYINHSVRRENCVYVPCGLRALALPDVLPSSWSREPSFVYVEAMRQIEAGEELLVDYGEGYWTWALTDEWPGSGLGSRLRRRLERWKRDEL